MLFNLLVYSALIVFIYMTGVYCIALYKKDNSIVDIAWGLGFVVLAYAILLRTPVWTARQLLVTVLITIWGLRLSWHIGARHVTQGEDPRYVRMRKKFKYPKLQSFFYIFMLQGVVMLVIAYPLILINAYSPTGLTLLDLVGLAVWMGGFALEFIADDQLKRFLAQPEYKGQVMTQGVWRYSRHPNYFGESIMWWGIFLIAYSVPHGITALVSPLLITYLLRFVSGVPLAEKQMKKLKGFAAYKRKTNIFVPLPVK